MNPRRMTIREAMIYAAEEGRMSGSPECYYWRAVWWRLHAKESKNSIESIGYSRAQMALYKDMLQRQKHYADSFRPAGVSDWQWSGLRAND